MRRLGQKWNEAIALYGGTFDPVHYGHLRTALEVHHLLRVADFRLLPAGDPPHRSSRVSPAHHRVSMLELAIEATPEFSIDRREIKRKGKSYMADTLAEIRKESGELPLLLILGQDSANTLDSWHRWKSIFDLAHLVVMNRPGDEASYSSPLKKVLEGRWVETPDELMNASAGRVLNASVSRLSISSSRIRDQIRSGESPRFLLPDAVLDYIRRHRVYD